MRAACLLGLAVAGCGRVNFDAGRESSDASSDVSSDALAMPSGLLHHWPCDEAPGTTIARDVVGGADAALAGASVFVGGGHSGNALASMDGASNPGGLAVVTAMPGDMIARTQITLSAWILRAQPNGIEQVGQEVNASTVDNNLSIQFWSDGLVYFCVGKGGAACCGRTPTGNDTMWHLAVLVFDGSQPTSDTRLVTYIDGQRQALDLTGTTISTTTPTLVDHFDLGAVSDNEGSDNGTIDDVRVYDHALSAAEVALLP